MKVFVRSVVRFHEVSMFLLFSTRPPTLLFFAASGFYHFLVEQRKNAGCLGSLGDYKTTQLFGDDKKP